jgi:hypothetical protein
VRKLPTSTTWPATVIGRMTRAELLDTLASFVLTPEKSLRQQAVDFCNSPASGTTAQLRHLARQNGIANSSSLSKKELCSALQAHVNVLLSNEHTATAASSSIDAEISIAEEEVEIPDFALDVITQDMLNDPIVADDGHTYSYHSLRNMFVVEQRRFERAGRPPGKPVVVRSPLDPSVVLQNPFDNIPNLPKATPLFRNKAIRKLVDAWRVEHGFAPPDPYVPEPPIDHEYERDGFQDGIFVEQEDEEEEEEDDDEEYLFLDVLNVPGWIPDIHATYAFDETFSDTSGITALMAAAMAPRASRLHELRIMLAAPDSLVEAKKQDSQGRTALMWATFTARKADAPDVMAVLLEHESSGTVARMETLHGTTALMIAASYARTMSTDVALAQLLAHESSRDVARMSNRHGRTPLMCAAMYSRTKSTEATVTQLLNHGSVYMIESMRDKKGNTALMLAAIRSHRTSTIATYDTLRTYSTDASIARLTNKKGLTAAKLFARAQAAEEE